MSQTVSRVLLSALLACFLITPAAADNILDLKRSFVETYKNRLTIGCNYYVDAAHNNPNPAKKDGDLHIAGRCSVIGVPVVAEIMNAKDRTDAVNAIHNVEDTGHTIGMSGVWRIWPEHGGDESFKQINGPGTAFDGSPPTNPPHVFEIHPLTTVAAMDLQDTLKTIQGFEEKDAEDAFQRYESASFEITPTAQRVKMRMRMVGYNYVKFVFRLTQRFHREQDGEFLAGSILSEGGELLVRKRRVGFVEGSAPDNVQKGMQVGQCLTLLGIPRLNLALVSWRIQHANDAAYPGALKWGMPYEIIAVGTYGGPGACEGADS